MGVFIDRSSFNPLPLNLNLDDPPSLTGLVCRKPCDLLFRHFVERAGMINGLVMYGGMQSAGVTGPIMQLALQLSDATDIAAMRAGMPLAWMDCATYFLDLTAVTIPLPNTPPPTTHLRLVIAPLAMASSASMSIGRSLLV